jgi:CBS domain-containing protein
MLTLREIMTPKVVSLLPEMTLREAIDVLATHHISGAPVVEQGRVVGVLSARDVVEFLASMVPERPTDDAEADAFSDRETGNGTTGEGTEYFVGLWSEAAAPLTARFDGAAPNALDLLGEHTVAEAMSPAPAGFRPSTDVREAADAMQRTGAHRVLVMESNRLVGIVSALDVARAAAQHRLQDRRYVFNARHLAT